MIKDLHRSYITQWNNRKNEKYKYILLILIWLLAFIFKYTRIPSLFQKYLHVLLSQYLILLVL